jgi:hypothetical protein
MTNAYYEPAKEIPVSRCAGQGRRKAVGVSGLEAIALDHVSRWVAIPALRRQRRARSGDILAGPGAPGRNAVVSTFAAHHGTSYGAIGIVSRRLGIEAPHGEGFRWITEEFPVIEDFNPFWAYRDPYPVSESHFLVSYGGGDLHSACSSSTRWTTCHWSTAIRPQAVSIGNQRGLGR